MLKRKGKVLGVLFASVAVWLALAAPPSQAAQACLFNGAVCTQTTAMTCVALSCVPDGGAGVKVIRLTESVCDSIGQHVIQGSSGNSILALCQKDQLDFFDYNYYYVRLLGGPGVGSSFLEVPHHGAGLELGVITGQPGTVGGVGIIGACDSTTGPEGCGP